MNAIFSAISIPDEDIQELALQNLAEVPSIGYAWLENYIVKVGEITMELLSKKNGTLINQALLFWNSVCKEEIKIGASDLSKQFGIKYQHALIKIVIEAMKVEELQDDEITLQESADDEKWLVINAAAGLLTDLSTLIKDSVWDPIWLFFQEQI